MSDGPWTHFWDMHSGGTQKLQWPHIFIHAPEEDAKRLFAEAFGRDPENVTCNCCGGDYSISEEPSLAQATAFQRNLSYTSPLGSGARWRSASIEERRHANEVGHYLEPDKEPPDGWAVDESVNVRLGYDKPMLFEDFMADPHFDHLGRRREVLLLTRDGAIGGSE